MLFDPLRRKTNKAEFLSVTNLDALPDDDLPHSFQVVADRRDAWNMYPAQRIGAVYLRRSKNKVTVIVFSRRMCVILLMFTLKANLIY